MDSVIALFMSALDPLRNLIMYLVGYAPTLLGGLVLLVVGLFLGRFVRDMVERFLNIIRLDEHLGRVHMGDILRRFGLGNSLSRLIGVIVYGVILIAFLMAATDAMGLGIVSVFLGQVVGFLPNVIAIAVILGGGLYLGDLAGRIIHRSATANRIRGAEALSRAIYGLMVLFSGVLALQVLGIDLVEILNTHARIIVGSIGLGCAIAFGISFGMAGRDMAAGLIRELMPKSSSKNGKVRLKRAA